MRTVRLPALYQQRLQGLLEELGYSWSRPGALAQAILRLSDFYIANPQSPTPWNEISTQAAYLSYYFPLNYARAHAVMNEAYLQGFFTGLESFVEIGSGLGSAQIALQESLQDAMASRMASINQESRQDKTNNKENNKKNSKRPEFLKGYCIERSKEALQLHQRLIQTKNTHHSASTPLQFFTEVPSHLPPARSRLAVLSYVYTEMATLPKWAEESEAVLLIEPSTREDGRRLLSLRTELIEKGFHPWAPCTHEGPCPLLTQSKKDWCHDRIEWQRPPGWDELEGLLPMQNRTLTFSYLLMRKSAPTRIKNARVIGDTLKEKGKSRQLICRGPDREFLSWFPQRLKQEPELNRGDLIRFQQDLEKKSDELRLREITDILIESASKDKG